MIYAELTGNLGNQMFIYACARKLQALTGQPVELNTYYMKKKHPDYKFSLGMFKLNDSVSVNSETPPPFFASIDSIFFKIIARMPLFGKILKKLYYKVFSTLNIFVWEDSSFVPINIKGIPRNIYIAGFWQDPHYFSDVRPLLLEDFALKDASVVNDADLLKKIRETESICVSIRRGDFVSNPEYKAKHFLCDEDYFKRSVEQLCEDVKNPTLIFFSDDVVWVKENIRFDYPSFYESVGNTLPEKIALMTSCKHFILSNSSFSWWVEYLADAPQKKVVAPSRWYANGIHADLYQDYWHLIEV